jgi:hypothetical protein
MKALRHVLWFIAVTVIGTGAQPFSEVTGWRMQDSSVVGATAGTTISTAAYNAGSWYTATVPGTVLSTLVDQGVYTDPYFGTYMVTTIPDLANQQRRYWYRAAFNVTYAAGQRVWLEIGGINYVATIFVNGTQVGTMYGAFREAKFDITSLVATGTTTNYVAVKIRGNYTPGTYHHQESGSCGNNGGIMSQDGPTFIADQGWDWIPTIPDRSMGIWKPVYVRVSGPVAIRHPWLRTLNVSAASATVPLQVMLRNSTAAAVTGTLSANIDGTTQFTPQTVTVPANDTLNVTFPNLTVTNPRLWWPNGYGDPNLYTCNITFTPNTGTVSDTNTFKFGVRQYTLSTNGTGGYLLITCNGQRILARGGNWGMDEAMKRWDLHRLENQVRYHKEMNFNMVRDWIGMTDREPFYDFCDKYGIMVWSDFWEPHSADAPTAVTDQANFIINMRDKIYRVRNHACVVLWCERNETTPTAAFLTALQNIYAELDGTRWVQPSSGSNGAHSGGPYGYTSPANAYNAISGFHTEFGPTNVPVYETMAAMLPANQLMPISNSYWDFHNYCDGNGSSVNYTNAMTTQYGAPTTIQQCCQRAQLMNYDILRAPFEALQVKRFTGATGLLLWMSNTVWPCLVWQTYDYYMDGTGAMWGSMKGSEPIHIMYYGTGTYNVSVVNSTRNAISNYTATAATYNLNGTRVWNTTATGVNIAADAANANVLNTAITPGTSTPYFLDLKLKDAAGNLVSHNFYWLPSSNTNITGMLTMTQASVAMPAGMTAATWTKGGVENTITLKIVNTSAVCAIACRLLLTRATSGARILPAHYNDNMFSLVPGDTQAVTAKFDDVDLAGEAPHLCLTGVNVPQTCFTIGGVVAARRSTPMDQGETKMFTVFSGNKLHMLNIAAGKAWEARIFDMQGKMVVDARGIAQENTAIVPAGQLRSGAYVATVTSAGKLVRSIIMVTGR